MNNANPIDSPTVDLPVESPSYDELLSLKGETVAMHDGTETAIPLTLTAVTPRTLVGEYESFSLEFSGPVDGLMEQGTYEFVHVSIPTFPIFLVPIGRTATDTTYEALFNRLVPHSR